ncbi:uncharacterized protein LTR77_008987 [Saxophila tyrrhenica]|uniref:BTB domain-containing protein n=1 Tax=Saxophila tyrrhenica TaxID=1690608 RepID=A0AAV9NZD0_9PEZI|nr:hypothetical protein LTR77_008987 [Saxophila tyrrhenica]
MEVEMSASSDSLPAGYEYKTERFPKNADPLREGIKKYDRVHPCCMIQANSVRLWRSNDLSDLTVRCGGREWSVHRFVLCTQSKYFERAVEGGFKESTEKLIELQEDDPKIVGLMLSWFYNRYYPADSAQSDTTPDDYLSEAQVHARVFALGEKHLLYGLMDKAVDGFRVEINEWWITIGVAKGIVEVYNMTSEASNNLRELAVKMVCTHRRDVMNLDSE